MTKHFMFVEKDLYIKETRPYYPYFTALKEKLGVTKSQCGDLYTEDQVLKLDLSKTTMKKIAALKEGKSTYIWNLSSGIDLELMRVTEDYVKARETQQSLEAEIDSLKAEIDSHIPVALKDRLRQLQKELKAVKNKQTIS
jgi:hypothetical protein